jgi:hypothetical protein
MISLTFEALRQHRLIITKKGKVKTAHQPMMIRQPKTFAPKISMIMIKFYWVPMLPALVKKIPWLWSKQTIKMRENIAGIP